MKSSDRLKKYISEKVLMVLFISASNLTDYSEDDLVDFADIIESAVGGQFEPQGLTDLKPYLVIPSDIFEDFVKLKNLLTSMYGSQWHNKLREQSSIMKETNELSNKILDQLNVEYMEPNTYRDSHFFFD